jgi:hypothetical protein
VPIVLRRWLTVSDRCYLLRRLVIRATDWAGSWRCRWRVHGPTCAGRSWWAGRRASRLSAAVCSWPFLTSCGPPFPSRFSPGPAGSSQCLALWLQPTTSLRSPAVISAYTHRVTLDKYTRISEELVDRLFLRPGIQVRAACGLFLSVVLLRNTAPLTVSPHRCPSRAVRGVA